MIRATTPTHRFIFEGIDPQTFKELNIYYAQQGIELIKKTIKDCSFNTKEGEKGLLYFVDVTLSQEETKLFTPKMKCKVQLRALTADNRALATDEYEVAVKDVINDEVLGDEDAG